LNVLDLISTFLVIMASISGLLALAGKRKGAAVFLVSVALLVLIYCWRNNINLVEWLENLFRKLLGSFNPVRDVR